MNYRDYHDKAFNELLEVHGAFFAFGNDQFAERREDCLTFGPQFDAVKGTIGELKLVKRWWCDSFPRQGRWTYSAADLFTARIVWPDCDFRECWCYPRHFDPVGIVRKSVRQELSDRLRAIGRHDAVALLPTDCSLFNNLDMIYTKSRFPTANDLMCFNWLLTSSSKYWLTVLEQLNA